SGKIELEHTTFSLNDIIVNLSNMIGFKAQEKGLELIISIDDTIPVELKGDPLRLGQILLNLANNAVKFTEKGEIVIEAVNQKISGNKAVIKFSITDTGIGMHSHEKDKIFNPFIQADTSTTRQYGGTGLGLAICRRFVEMMNGTIGVESEYGKGSVFYFTVELEISKLKRENITFPENLKNKKALVADDNKTSCRVLSSYLEKLSFKTTSVYSGEEVLSEIKRTELSKEEPYAIIFLDWEMPGINGIETAKRIIGTVSKEILPRIIMVTGYEQEEIFLMANDIGLDGFIIKPVTSSTLLDVITNTLSPHKMKTEIRQHTETKYAGISLISGASILVVEDNEINREVAREILENEGLTVDLASNGLEAYNKLAEYGYKKYDLVLMDLQMPVMGGFESAILIREKISSSELPIIAMTADVASDIKEKVKQHGMNGYISKPINTIELFSSILEFIKPVQLNRKEKLSGAPNEIKKIPVVRGLDTAKGLSIIGGNVKLYRKLLLNFADSYRQGDTELKELFSKNEMIKMGEFLHKLKGVSGNLGFTTIPALSDMIVRNLNNGGEEKIVTSIEEIAVSLKNSVEDILNSPYIKDFALPQNKETAGKLSSSLKELRGLLDTDHSEALILIETIIDSFPDSEYIKNLERISSLLNIFDIDCARDLVNAAIEQLDLGERNA
ncbi:MAG: hypothetical protein CVV49_08370, partial [Spirochaetae bacterium HGW-Spirochaetae-5]